jgi:hypothetical protein
VARARSRKRRPTGAKRASASTAQKSAPAKVRDRAGAPGSSDAARRSRSPAAPTYGERPNAPWHPLPLSELLILIGAIAAALGLVRSGHDSSGGGRLLLAGLAAVGIGTVEVTLREHRSGYRSHTVMLAGLLVLVFDSILVLVLTAITSLPRLFSVVLIAIDFALFAILFKLLRARFVDARHARVIREG